MLISDVHSKIDSACLQLQTQGTLGIPGRCYKFGQCMKLCGRRSVCLCSQSGGGAGIGLVKLHLQTFDWDRKLLQVT